MNHPLASATYVARNNPKCYAEFMVDLDACVKASYNGKEFTASPEIREVAEILNTDG
jgi:hypothetical protein